MIEQQMDLVDAMRMGVEYRFPITVRGVSIMLRPLSVSEHHEIAARVLSELKAKPVEYQTEANQASLTAIYTIERATSSDVDKLDNKLHAVQLSRLATSELMYLYGEYLKVLDRVDPVHETIPEPELMKYVDEVKKSPGEALAGLSFRQIVRVVEFLVTSGG